MNGQNRYRITSKTAPKRLIQSLFLVVTLGSVTGDEFYFEVEQDQISTLEADFELAMGIVEIGVADEGYIFQGEVKLEEMDMEPEFDYEVSGGKGELSVGLESEKGQGRSFRFQKLPDASSSRWTLFLGRETPVDLEIEMGAAKSVIDLTDIPVERLRVEAGAAKSEIVFDELNPVRMSEMSIETGMSEISVEGIGYANTKKFSFEGGMGKFNLDFAGPTRNLIGLRANIEVGMSSISVVVPDNVPVILEAEDTWVNSVSVPDSFRKGKDGLWYAGGARTRSNSLSIQIEAGVGKVVVVTE